MEPPPLCSKPRCSRPSTYYSKIGGYGKLCPECAALKASAQRRRRAMLNQKPEDYKSLAKELAFSLDLLMDGSKIIENKTWCENAENLIRRAGIVPGTSRSCPQVEQF